MTTRLLALLGTLGLSACASAPTHYYTLLPTAAPAATRTDLAAATFQFEMRPVRVPVQVDQPEVVVREGVGSLALLETERWSAPLADEFHDALVSQLEINLGLRDMAGLARHSKLPILSLQVEVRRFDSVSKQYALIDVVWSMSQRASGQERRSLTCSSVIRQAAGPKIADLVAAHQQAIGQLAGIIATTARSWSALPATTCP